MQRPPAPLAVGLQDFDGNKEKYFKECRHRVHCMRGHPWWRVVHDSGLPFELVNVNHVAEGYYDDNTSTWMGKSQSDR